jgi:hypothetical protein
LFSASSESFFLCCFLQTPPWQCGFWPVFFPAEATAGEEEAGTEVDGEAEEAEALAGEEEGLAEVEQADHGNDAKEIASGD